ncbi:MAG: hypothetical protein ACR2RV_06200, partial [Verrucomicrobiales bacterium]
MSSPDPLRLALVCLFCLAVTACSHRPGGDPTLTDSAYQISGQSSTALLATAQLCEASAQDIKNSDPARALGLYLQAAKATLEAAVAGEPESRTIYNRSVANATELAFTVGRGEAEKLVVPGPDGDWRIDIDVPQYDSDPLQTIDSLSTADSIKRNNRKNNDLRKTVTRDGIGGTLVAYQANPPEHASKRPYRLPIGMSLPATAVADFSGTNRARIRIYDTMLSEDVSLSGRRLPLAANYSASLTKLMSYSPAKSTG